MRIVNQGLDFRHAQANLRLGKQLQMVKVLAFHRSDSFFHIEASIKGVMLPF